jgi:hypothetical protein
MAEDMAYPEFSLEIDRGDGNGGFVTVFTLILRCFETLRIAEEKKQNLDLPGVNDESHPPSEKCHKLH